MMDASFPLLLLMLDPFSASSCNSNAKHCTGLLEPCGALYETNQLSASPVSFLDDALRPMHNPHLSLSAVASLAVGGTSLLHLASKVLHHYSLWFLFSGFWLCFCFMFIVVCVWFLVSGFWFLVYGLWFLVSSSSHLFNKSIKIMMSDACEGEKDQ
jgi:hypothetical protein